MPVDAKSRASGSGSMGVTVDSVKIEDVLKKNLNKPVVSQIPAEFRKSKGKVEEEKPKPKPNDSDSESDES